MHHLSIPNPTEQYLQILRLRLAARLQTTAIVSLTWPKAELPRTPWTRTLDHRVIRVVRADQIRVPT